MSTGEVSAHVRSQAPMVTNVRCRALHTSTIIIGDPVRPHIPLGPRPVHGSAPAWVMQLQDQLISQNGTIIAKYQTWWSTSASLPLHR